MRWERFVLFALIAVDLICWAGCAPEGEAVDTTPPAKPVLKPHSVETDYAETGIRPEAVTDPRNYWIGVEWYRNLEDDLGGYLVYRHDEGETEFPTASIGNLILRQNLSPNIDPYFVDMDTWNLQPNDTTGETRGYWYAVRAYDQLGNVSEFSEATYYRLIANPLSFNVTGSAVSGYYLEWTYESSPGVLIDYYMLRVWDAGTNEPMWWMRYTEFSSTHRVLLNADGTAQPFVSGRSYVWKLNVVANSGQPTRSPAGSAVKRTFVY
jgi:hypothetical protein